MEELERRAISRAEELEKRDTAVPWTAGHWVNAHWEGETWVPGEWVNGPDAWAKIEADLERQGEYRAACAAAADTQARRRERERAEREAAEAAKGWAGRAWETVAGIAFALWLLAGWMPFVTLPVVACAYWRAPELLGSLAWYAGLGVYIAITCRFTRGWAWHNPTYLNPSGGSST